MKKILIVLLLIQFFCVLTGCNVSFDGEKGEIVSNLTKLSAPTDLIVENNIVSWKSVANADSYIININEKESATSELSYPIFGLVNESCQVAIKVKAKGNGILYSDSDWSSIYTYDYVEEEISTNSNETYSLLEEYSLGSGINAITGEYLTYDAFLGNEFLDKEKLAKDFKISTLNAKSTDLLYIDGTSIKDFSLEFAAEYSRSSSECLGLSVGNLFGFSGTLSNRFKISVDFKLNEATKEYYYMSYQLIADKSRSIKNFSEDKIREGDYISDVALLELEKIKEAQGQVREDLIKKFFKNFGTHIVKDAVYGGKIEFYYYYIQNDGNWDLESNLDINSAISAGLSASDGDVNVGAGAANSSELDAKLKLNGGESSYTSKFLASATGGKGFERFSFSEFSFAYKNWIDSYNSEETHNTMIGIKENGLCPIWDLLPEEYAELQPILQQECTKYISLTNNEFLNKFTKEVYSNTTDYAGGAGTVTNPYLISEAVHLKNISLNPNSHFELVNDIDLSVYKNWDPIKDFTGTLDGNGFKITKIKSIIDIYSETILLGLFDENKGAIFDLNITDSIFKISPAHQQKNVRVYCGSIAGKNTGKISNCIVSNTQVIANTSNIAEIYGKTFNISVRDISIGNSNEWKQWVSQDYNPASSTFGENLYFEVYSGGITAYNVGEIISCKFQGKIEGNLFNMMVPNESDSYPQLCYVGGVCAYNFESGTVNNSSSQAEIAAWCDFTNDCNGSGWGYGGDVYVSAKICVAGIVGFSENNSVLLNDETDSTISHHIRHYAPETFFGSANYDRSSKSHGENICIYTSNDYNTKNNAN